MRSINMLLCAAAMMGTAMFAQSANAQWGRYRVTSSYSLPSVPYYAYQPVVQPAIVQPAVAYSPVIVNQPVVVSRPVVVAQPAYGPAPIIVRRGLFRRPVVVGGFAPVAPTVYPAPAPVAIYNAQQGVSRSYYGPVTSFVPQPVYVP
jgi:hypothetical protein